MTDTPQPRQGLLASFIVLVLAAATLVVAAPASAAESCGDQFNDSDAPDDAECAFSCKAAQQLVIAVDASDDDATASGSARCGGGYSPCRSSGNSCQGEDGISATASSSGKCAAVVSELWNSAWSYNCSSKDVEGSGCVGPSCGDPGNPPRCIFDIVCCPAAVCVGEDAPSMPCFPGPQVVVPGPRELLERIALCGPSANLHPATDAATGLPAGVTSRIDVWVSASGVATGRLCNAGVGCWSILPMCSFEPGIGRAECVVSAAPKILGPAAPYGV